MIHNYVIDIFILSGAFTIASMGIVIMACCFYETRRTW